MRKFTSGEAAALLGVNDSYLRKLHLDGKGPPANPRLRNGSFSWREGCLRVFAAQINSATPDNEFFGNGSPVKFT